VWPFELFQLSIFSMQTRCHMRGTPSAAFYLDMAACCDAAAVASEDGYKLRVTVLRGEDINALSLDEVRVSARRSGFFQWWAPNTLIGRLSAETPRSSVKITAHLFPTLDASCGWGVANRCGGSLLVAMETAVAGANSTFR
jgi:hypothetical protein